MISFKQLSLSGKVSAINWKTWIWIGLGLVAVPALRIYYVQELLAALIAFSILFVALYAVVLAIFLLARASKPIVVWAVPRVDRVLNWGFDAAEIVIANRVWAKAAPVWAKTVPVWAKALPVWAKAVPQRFGRVVRASVDAVEVVMANRVWVKAVPVWAKAVPQRFGRVVRASVDAVEVVMANRVWVKAVPVWAKAVRQRFGRVARTSVDAVEGVIANPVWAKAAPAWAKSVPVWTKTVPHGFRKQQLKLNENYKMVRLRFARLRPSRVYRLSLQKGGAALTSGLRTHKRISNELGSWLTQRVRYSDLIRLPSISRARLSARGGSAHRRR